MSKKINSDDLEKISVEIADDLLNKERTFEHMDEIVEAPVVAPKIKTELPKTLVPATTSVDHQRQKARVTFQKPTHNAVSTQPTIEAFSIAGVDLPKQTCYLVIVLIVIGAILFYKKK